MYYNAYNVIGYPYSINNSIVYYIHGTFILRDLFHFSFSLFFFTVTVDNKGSYSWPKTVAGHVVELPCQAEIGLGYARYNCTLDGRWSSLNTSVCPFVSETTRILQQYARVMII